jgi:hypothetical protein
MNKSYYLIGVILVLAIAGAAWYSANKNMNSANNITANQTQNSPSGKNTDNSEKKPMTFFVTSANPGRGADLGGLSGADNYCQSLANSAGAGGRTWRAYLSANAINGQSAVNARDRIGEGPWYNFNGELIAANIEELHSNNNITKQTALTEKGGIISGRGDEVNLHDILTGSTPEGTAIATSTDATCKNWTEDGEGSAMLGHHDRQGLRDDASSKSWNSSHFSRGCGLEALKSTGGGGLFYCFAVKE